MALLLELIEQAAEPAAQHAAGSTTREQATEAALEDIAETAAATGQAGRDIAGQLGRSLRRRRARLATAEMLHGLPGQQAQDRHGHRRHTAFIIGIAWGAGATRAVLHAVEYVE